MPTMTMADLAEKMKAIDILMLSTHGDAGEIASRPMSNNRDVDYDGDSYFFTLENTEMVRDIRNDANVALQLQAGKHMLGKPGIMINIQGVGELIRDKQMFREHWKKELDRWFEQGVDTPGLVLIKVRAKHIKYWDGEEEGEVSVRPN